MVIIYRGMIYDKIFYGGKASPGIPPVARERFWTGGVQNSKIVSTDPPFLGCTFLEAGHTADYLDRYQLHARSSDGNFFRKIFYHGKQDCFGPTTIRLF